MEKRGIKIAAQNRKAYHDYFVEERYDCLLYTSPSPRDRG